jgi:ketosteroid isomerase-like protein
LELLVQSDATSRKLGAVDRELIAGRLRALLEMRQSEDLRGMLAYAAEDIRFNVKGDWEAFPFTRPVQGKAMMAKALEMIVVQYESLGSIVHDLLIDGNRVAMRRTSTIRHRGTGKVIDVDIADFILFRDGLVAEFTEIPDSMALAQLRDG